MNLIIQIVLRIFDAIFEKDRLRRLPPDERRGAEAQPAPPPPRPSTQTPPEPQSLEQWLTSLLTGEKPKSTTVGKDQPGPARPGPVRPSPPKHQTLQEHIRQNEERLRRRHLKAAREEKLRVMKHGRADVHYEIKDRARDFDSLPGESVLEKAIYAGVILGPCKAHQHTRLL